MPYLMLKRSDIPPKTLQVLDLTPNTSLRSQTIDPPGQTLYVNPPVNDLVATYGSGPVYVLRDSSGLAAYFLTQVAAGPVVQATGTVQIAAGNVTAGDTVVIGGVTLTAVVGAPAAGEYQIGGSEALTATNLSTAIALVGNGLTGVVTPVPAGDTVTLTAVPSGTAGNSITLATNDPLDVILSGATLTGGADAPALTAAEANKIATNILDNLLHFGDPLGPAVAMDLVAVNAEIAGVVGAASIDAAQLRDVLDIISGRPFTILQDTQVADGALALQVVAAPGKTLPAMGPYRRIFNTDAVMLSKGTGQLAGFTSTTWSYLGQSGEALVVYNDDGTLFM